MIDIFVHRISRKKAESMGLSDSVLFAGNIVNPQDAYCAMECDGAPLAA